MHTPGSARTVLTDFLQLHMHSESPRHSKQTCDLFFPTNCLRGLLLSCPVSLFLLQSRDGRALPTIIFNLGRATTEEKGKEKKEGRREAPVELTQEFTKHTEECQAISFFPKHHKATANKRRSLIRKELQQSWELCLLFASLVLGKHPNVGMTN